MRPSDLKPDEYAAFYAGYVALVPDTTLRSALDESLADLLDYLTHLPEDRQDYAYAPGKWTVKECLQHIIDTERIFAYRALRFARADATPLPGYDQDEYVAAFQSSRRSFRNMIDELRLLRQSNILMFRDFSQEEATRSGTMSGGTASVRALGFIMCGHMFHHGRLYRERY